MNNIKKLRKILAKIDPIIVTPDESKDKKNAQILQLLLNRAYYELEEKEKQDEVD